MNVKTKVIIIESAVILVLCGLLIFSVCSGRKIKSDFASLRESHKGIEIINQELREGERITRELYNELGILLSEARREIEGLRESSSREREGIDSAGKSIDELERTNNEFRKIIEEASN